jgi:UDP-3-O-[3-hydroxymyristoyl] N-acetylglucosamine deacetylase
MKIDRILAYRVELPLHETTYKWSGGKSVAVFDSTLVRVETDTGLVGHGEVCPLGPFYLPAYAAGCRAGIKELAAPRKTIQILRPLQIQDGDKRIALYPSERFKITYSISFDHPMLRHQQKTMEIDEPTFVNEIAPARTFGFLKEVEMLRQNGLALGGSLENAIVLGETGVLNNALRFEDEFVRHKILDAIGDLALVGYPVIGHLVAHRAGHALHTEFAAKILEETNAWRLVESAAEPVALPLAGHLKAAPRLAN